MPAAPRVSPRTGGIDSEDDPASETGDVRSDLLRRGFPISALRNESRRNPQHTAIARDTRNERLALHADRGGNRCAEERNYSEMDELRGRFWQPAKPTPAACSIERRTLVRSSCGAFQPALRLA